MFTPIPSNIWRKYLTPRNPKAITTSIANNNVNKNILNRTTIDISTIEEKAPYTKYYIAVNKINENLSAQYQKIRHSLSQKALELGCEFLAPKGSAEYNAIKTLMKGEFVCIRDKASALRLFREQHQALHIQSNSDVLVFNPSNLEKAAKSKKGSSNIYMSEWYASANGLKNKVVTAETIQNAINKSKSDIITIVVPDDCSISGRSIITNTARILNNVEIPAGKRIKLVYSPLVTSSTAESAFQAASKLDLEELKNLKIICNQDEEFMRQFFEKYKGKIEISSTSKSITAKPFYESDYFKYLQKNNPELADRVESILSNNRTAYGYGRTGQSGVLVIVPSENGLKCPNNNAYGAAPFAIAEGAAPITDLVKVPGGNIKAKKWANMLNSMSRKIQSLLDSIS